MSETRDPELDKPNCAPGRNRTYDTRFRKPVLYPLSYEGPVCRKRGMRPQPMRTLSVPLGAILALGREASVAS